MDVIETHIHTDSDLFRDNRAHLERLVAELGERLAVVRRGGGDKAIERHRQQGKLPVRERVDRLLDPGSPWLELSTLAAWDMYGGDAPCAGLVTGIGRVSGREVMVVANDATVKGGTYYPITVKKHLRAQQVALDNRGLPRPRSLRPHLLQPGPDVRRADPAGGRRHGLVHGRRRLRTRDVG
jgi:3-methylcrotonyl-CoA carboxylase beta subunit